MWSKPFTAWWWREVAALVESRSRGEGRARGVGVCIKYLKYILCLSVLVLVSRYSLACLQCQLVERLIAFPSCKERDVRYFIKRPMKEKEKAMEPSVLYRQADDTLSTNGHWCRMLPKKQREKEKKRYKYPSCWGRNLQQAVVTWGSDSFILEISLTNFRDADGQ